jgi:hypothetical protein
MRRVARAMIETNKERATAPAASSCVPLRSTTAVGDVRLEPYRLSRCVAAGPHSRLVRGGVGGARTGAALCAWAGLARSTLTDAASRILKLLALSSRGSSQPSLPLLDGSLSLPRRRKRSSFTKHTVSRTAAARPRALHRFERRTVFPHANAHETHAHCRRTGSTKSAELRANQEAGFGAEHRDKKTGESSAFCQFCTSGEPSLFLFIDRTNVLQSSASIEHC